MYLSAFCASQAKARQPSAHFHTSGVPAGSYEGQYSWENADGTATQVGKVGGITITGNSTFNFTLP